MMPLRARAARAGGWATRLRSLAGVLARTFGAAALVFGLSFFVGARVDPVILGGVALVAGVAWWLGEQPGAEPLVWPGPPEQPGQLSAAADAEARALSNLLSSAAPGRAFSTNRVAGRLAAIASARLVARHDADPAEPLAAASAHLSPGLIGYLGTLDHPDVPPPALSRRVLRAYLKELEEL